MIKLLRKAKVYIQNTHSEEQAKLLSSKVQNNFLFGAQHIWTLTNLLQI